MSIGKAVLVVAGCLLVLIAAGLVMAQAQPGGSTTQTVSPGTVTIAPGGSVTFDRPGSYVVICTGQGLFPEGSYSRLDVAP